MVGKQKQLGFTIVELLIVIIVIGILAAIIIVMYSSITKQAYYSRSQSELATIAKAVQMFNLNNSRYPADVGRGIPAEITPYLNGTSAVWPLAPWPNSVYDYDYFTGSDGKEVSQISIRFCPIDASSLSECNFPNEPWASGFGVNSSAYWCVTGKCRAHPDESDSYPAYCINCVH